MSISVTASAAQRIDSQLAKRGKGLGLRLGVRKSGCSGFAYTIDYADEIAPGEQVFEQHGTKIVVHPDHLPMLSGVTIDFTRQGLNEAFRFINPNIKGECGCGESFTV